ncbi:MAG TPA: glycosyltransferase family 39 protein, partial [Ardenticatenaceae bacterium]|nr:glycosyltransferase family 39 protein [Ardenticatenaceae bacterium]
MTPGRTPWRLLVALGLFSLAVRALAALPLRDAGYFDAFYYYHVAQNMAAGRGMVEDMIWNYLDQSPAAMQLPRPSHLYWMPLTTWIAWAGIRLFGRAVGEFRGALVPFVLLSALLPPLSGWIAWQLWRRRDFVLAAALLTLFSGFYFLYWVVPDNYTPFALAVALSLLGCWLGGQGHRSGWLLAGLGAGLSHLSRADGILLVPTIALLITRTRPTTPAAPPTIPISNLLPAALLAAAGYVAVVAPWLLRNVAVAGTPLPGGGL